MANREKGLTLDEVTYSRLWEAINKGWLNAPDMIREAAANGFDVNHTNKNGLTLLHWAGVYNNPRCCDALVDLGVDINKRDKQGYTAFYASCLAGSEQSALALCERDANWRIPDLEGNRPLRIIKNPRFRAELQDYIIERSEKRFELEAPEEDPMTKLCRNGQVEAAKVLIDNGARGDLPNKQGVVPFDLITDSEKRAELLAYTASRIMFKAEQEIERYGRILPEEDPIAAACRLGDVQSAKILIDNGARGDFPNKDGIIPFNLITDPAKRAELEAYTELALKNRTLDMQKYAMAVGAGEKNIKDPTPGHYMAAMSDEEIKKGQEHLAAVGRGEMAEEEYYPEM